VLEGDAASARPGSRFRVLQNGCRWQGDKTYLLSPVEEQRVKENLGRAAMATGSFLGKGSYGDIWKEALVLGGEGP
jgi:hypothetical protein